jgi:hypothetical protein
MTSHGIGSIVPALAESARAGHPQFRNGKEKTKMIRRLGHPPGYKYWSVGRDIGYDEYRLPTEGQNSTHFLVSQSPRVTVPSAKGSGHVGEYYPGFDHFWHDILHQ